LGNPIEWEKEKKREVATGHRRGNVKIIGLSDVVRCRRGGQKGRNINQGEKWKETKICENGQD